MDVYFCPDGHEHPSGDEAIARGCAQRVDVYPDSDPEPYVSWDEGH